MTILALHQCFTWRGSECRNQERMGGIAFWAPYCRNSMDELVNPGGFVRGCDTVLPERIHTFRTYPVCRPVWCLQVFYFDISKPRIIAFFVDHQPYQIDGRATIVGR